MDKHITIERAAGNVFVGESPEYKKNAAINELLNLLASKPFEFSQVRRRPSAETVTKIQHNNIKSKIHIIKQYLDQSAMIESAFNEINSLIPFGKDIIFRNLNGIYLAVLDGLEIDYLLGEDQIIEAVRENSELIIDSIIARLRNAAYEAKNAPNLKEYIDDGVNVVVAHAFIECVVMENPGDDS